MTGLYPTPEQNLNELKSASRENVDYLIWRITQVGERLAKPIWQNKFQGPKYYCVWNFKPEPQQEYVENEHNWELRMRLRGEFGEDVGHLLIKYDPASSTTDYDRKSRPFLNGASLTVQRGIFPGEESPDEFLRPEDPPLFIEFRRKGSRRENQLKYIEPGIGLVSDFGEENPTAYARFNQYLGVIKEEIVDHLGNGFLIPPRSFAG